MGIVLAAGAGRRLLPHTEDLPKTLVPVSEKTTILDVILSNFGAVGLTEVAVVVGHAAAAVRGRVAELEGAHGVRLHLIHNDRIDWNNAYSLWMAREAFAGGALLVNGDTMHPVAVEKTLLTQRGAPVSLAVDTLRDLTGEAMKVRLDDTDRVVEITKAMPVTSAHGEYIGAAVLEPAVAPELTDCLVETWRRDPHLYYEDAFQLLADRTGGVRAARLGALDWVEVDDSVDLARAREIFCRY
jgi:choline kinase